MEFSSQKTDIGNNAGLELDSIALRLQECCRELHLKTTRQLTLSGQDAAVSVLSEQNKINNLQERIAELYKKLEGEKTDSHDIKIEEILEQSRQFLFSANLNLRELQKKLYDELEEAESELKNVRKARKTLQGYADGIGKE